MGKKVPGKKTGGRAECLHQHAVTMLTSDGSQSRASCPLPIALSPAVECEQVGGRCREG